MKLLEYLGKKVGTLKAERQPWNTKWSEISRYVRPSYVDRFVGSATSFNNDGNDAKYEDRIFDVTARVASRYCTAVLYSMITPRNLEYQELSPVSSDLARDMYVKQFFSELNKAVMFYRNQSKAGFVSSVIDFYMSLVHYGWAVTMVEEAETTDVVMSYRSIPIYECYIETDYQSKVNTLIRTFALKASQIAEQFGADVLTEKMRTEIASGNETVKYEIIHAVFPRSERRPNSLHKKDMAYASVYACLDEKLVLSEGGYRTFPYIVAFYNRVPGETYGRSICEEILPVIKAVNTKARDYATLSNRVAIPTFLTPANSIVNAKNLIPGKMVRGGLSSDGGKLVQPMEIQTGHVQQAMEAIMQDRQVINEALLVTWFQILQKTPEMTATEYMGRETEKSVLVSPAIGRLQEQFISVLIERELDILSFRKLLPEIPPVLEEVGVDYRVAFNAPINKIERSQQANGVLRTIEALSVLTNGTQDPSYMDIFNKDRVQIAIADYYSVDPLLLNTPEEKQAISQSRQAANEQQQILQAAPSMASMMKVAKG